MFERTDEVARENVRLLEQLSQTTDLLAQARKKYLEKCSEVDEIHDNDYEFAMHVLSLVDDIETLVLELRGEYDSKDDIQPRLATLQSKVDEIARLYR